jgi:hypothetical protein
MSGSIFLGNIHHAYAQTDGTYAFPNSREGDMLKQAVRELLVMREERDEARRRFCTMSVQLGQFYRRVGGQSVQVTTPEDVADIMGWNCFEENTDYLQDLG